jgi:hypothetical protein
MKGQINIGGIYAAAIAVAVVLLSGCHVQLSNSIVASEEEAAKDAARDSNTFSIGKRVGQVVKLSRKGWNNTRLSYEGHLLVGGGLYHDTEDGTVITQDAPWEFSVSDEDNSHAGIVADLNTAMGTGERVALVYREVKSSWGMNTDTDYHVRAVLHWREGKWEYLDGRPYVEGKDGLPALPAEKIKTL